MKERPILFSTPMVRAIMEGRKTMTRRIIKFPKGWVAKDNAWDWVALQDFYPKWQCPYNVGGVLWVRETFRDLQKTPVIGAGAELYIGIKYWYRASNKGEREICGGRWKPGIHMPKEAARIWLQVESVKVERLQEISEEDAKAEGVPEYYLNQKTTDGSNYTYGFNCLWNEINGKESWEENPWVWVIKFKVLSTTGKP